jgi:short-subunit dehydrogenase
MRNTVRSNSTGNVHGIGAERKSLAGLRAGARLTSGGGCLHSQRALVTGASGGIGSAIAIELARNGVEVCLSGRNRSRLLNLAATASGLVPKVIPFVGDLTRKTERKRLCRMIEVEFGALDILIHSAGAIVTGPLGEAKLEDFEKQLKINLLQPYHLTQLLLPLLRKSKGQIVFINSSIISNPRPNIAQFAPTQHALKGFADCLRAEVNDSGVRVISVFPGRTATPRQERIFRAEGRTYCPERLLQSEDVAKTIVSALGLAATAEVTDIHLRPTLKH